MFDKSLLYYFVRDALKLYSEDLAVIDKSNPTIIQLNGDLYSIHLSYIHDSGNQRDNEDEARIQISKYVIEEQRECLETGYTVAFVGFFEGGKSFTVWDPRHVLSLQTKTVVSIYARQSQ